MTTSPRLSKNYMKRHIPGYFTTSSIPKTTDMNMHDYIVQTTTFVSSCSHLIVRFTITILFDTSTVNNKQFIKLS